MTGALEGLRVVEHAQLIAGPYCGKLLADLGAEVIKVEPPEGDEARRWGPFSSGKPDPERSGLFLYLNTNKRGVTAPSVPDALMEHADVLISDARTSPYEALHPKYPSLIVVSVTPFGTTGPYRDRPASDLTVFHASGVAHETPQHGVPDLDQPPLRPGGYPAYFQAGGVAATATMTAIFARALTGEGEHVDVSHLEALTGIMTRINMHQHTYEGKEPSRRRHAEYQVDYVPCKDGYVNIQVHFPHWWRAMVKAIGDPEWAQDPLFESADFRDQAWDILAPLLAEWAKDYTRKELFDHLQRHHVPCLPGYSFDDVVEDPHLKARGYWTDISGFRMPGPPYRLSKTPWAIRRSYVSLRGAAGTGAGGAGDRSSAERLVIWGGQASGSAPASPRTQIATSAAPPRNDREARLPLLGIRVLDFTWVFAGPTCTMLLAASGAEVIKVESRNRPDSTRRQRAVSPAGVLEPSTGGGFDGLNFGKRAVTLNLKEGRAVELVKQLVSLSDVLVQNYSYGVMERLGIGYDDLVKVRPDLVMLSMSLFGRDGPYRDYFGYGGPLPVFTGQGSITGYPGGLEQTVGASWPDPLNGVNATFAILAALHHRRKTGEGQHIDLSMADGSIATLADGVIEYSMNGRVLGLEGNRDRRFAPHNTYRCKGEDQWVAIAVSSDAEWHALCVVIGLPASQSRQEQDKVDALIGAWTASRDKREVEALLIQAGVPAAASLNRAEVLADPHLQERGAFVSITRASGTEEKLVPALPWHMSRSESRYAKAPNLGEDNAYVFGEVLGLGKAELRALEDDQVVY